MCLCGSGSIPESSARAGATGIWVDVAQTYLSQRESVNRRALHSFLGPGRSLKYALMRPLTSCGFLGRIEAL